MADVDLQFLEADSPRMGLVINPAEGSRYFLPAGPRLAAQRQSKTPLLAAAFCACLLHPRYSDANCAVSR